MFWIFYGNLQKDLYGFIYHYIIFYVLFDFGVCYPPPIQGIGYMYECEPIQADMCKLMPYNMTHMPNILGQESQNEVEVEIHRFKYEYFIATGCSEDLRLFLCAVYTPMCNKVSFDPFPPCRALCESVRKGCEPVVKSRGYNWPEHLNCIKYPETGFCFDKIRNNVNEAPKDTLLPETSTIGSSISENTKTNPTCSLLSSDLTFHKNKKVSSMATNATAIVVRNCGHPLESTKFGILFILLTFLRLYEF